ncbi:hypothetical protein [Paraburkholderia strydomiana]
MKTLSDCFDAADTLSEMALGSRELGKFVQIDDMLALADRELDKGNVRYFRLTYGRAVEDLKRWNAIKAWPRLALFSVEARLRNGGSRTHDSFEWKALDMLFKELSAGLGQYPKTSGHSIHTLVDLGNFYVSSKRFAEARQAFELASSHIPQLQLLGGTNKAKTLCHLFMGWAELDDRTQEYEGAESNFESALSNARRLGEGSEAFEMLATVLVRVSSFYLARERYVASEATAKEALSLWRVLARAGNEAGKRGLHVTLGVLERLFTHVGRQDEISLIRRSLNIQRLLPK